MQQSSKVDRDECLACIRAKIELVNAYDQTELSEEQVVEVNNLINLMVDSYLELRRQSDGVGECLVLEEIEKLWPLASVRSFLASSRIVRLVVENMLSQGEKLEISMRITRSLSLIQKGREELVKQRAVSRLVGLIHSSSPEVLACALRAIFNLSVVDVQIRQQIVNAGALPLLIQCALEETDGQCAAIGTLANLATETDIKRSIVQDFNGLKPLLQLLDSREESILTHACRALFAIAANDENKKAIAKAGGLPRLLACMDWPADSVRMNAAGALANLAIHPINKLKLVELGALAKLRALAYSSNSKIQRQVARCLFALAAHVDNRKAIIDGFCLTALVRLLNSENSDVQLNAAGAVGNIAMTDAYKAEVVRAGALDRLVELSGFDVDRVQRQTARAIFTLTAKDIAKVRLAQLDGLPSLIQLTTVKNEDVQRDAAGALANMAIGTEHKDTIVRLGGLQPLILLLKSTCVAVQRQSARAIFALAGTEFNQQKILECDGLLPLIELLDSPNDEVQKHACGALANLSNRHPHKVVAFEGSLETLAKIVLEHPNLEVRRQAARAVYNLSPQGNQRRQMMLSPYAGVAGEQQRIRHDMRALFQMTIQSQLSIHESMKDQLKTSVPEECISLAADSIRLESQYQPQGLASGPTSSLNELPEISASRNASLADIPFGESTVKHKRSRKRGHEVIAPSYGNKRLAGSHSKPHLRCASRMAKSGNCFEHDVHLVLPVPSQIDGLLGEREAANEDGVEDRAVLYMDFKGHAAILASRCALFNSLITEALQHRQRALARANEELTTCHPNDLGPRALVERLAKQELFVRVPDRFAHSIRVWCAFVEYLYTDSVRVHAQTLRESQRMAAELADFAMQNGMPRLCCFCLELNEKVTQIRPDIRKVNIDDNRASTWVADMNKLLGCGFDGPLTPTSRNALPDFTDLQIKLDSSSVQEHDTILNARHGQRWNAEVPLTPKRLKCFTGSPVAAQSSNNGLADAHKIILATRCSYFKALFGNSTWSDSTASNITFHGTEEALRVILRYLYCGVDARSLWLPRYEPSLALQVLVLANEYGIDGLQNQCELLLMSYIDDETIPILLQELEYVHAPLLRSVCIHYLLKRLHASEANELDCSWIPDTLREELVATAQKWALEIPIFSFASGASKESDAFENDQSVHHRQQHDGEMICPTELNSAPRFQVDNVPATSV
mmetsp:Transcript_9793/g.17246  ORF Transcript_9793/g.17246 Transcript_9793/m.17246 type:complete len:1197 (-) Transcript_9793:84-3674(-)